MKNPQTENGHIKIATGDPDNDILSALIMAKLSGMEYQIVLWILRKTWGFNKKTDRIAIGQFMKITDRKKHSVIHALDHLIDKNIILGSRNIGKNGIFQFNKDFDSWMGGAQKSTTCSKTSKEVLKKAQRGAQKSTSEVLKKAPNKSNYNKSNITKAIGTKKPTKKAYKQKIQEFFEACQLGGGPPFEKVLEHFEKQGYNQDIIRTEIKAFVNFWTETNPGCKKAQWEFKKTFDPMRRFATWMRFSKNNSNNKSKKSINL